jgi:hypothetical protein
MATRGIPKIAGSHAHPETCRFMLIQRQPKAAGGLQPHQAQTQTHTHTAKCRSLRSRAAPYRSVPVAFVPGSEAAKASVREEFASMLQGVTPPPEPTPTRASINTWRVCTPIAVTIAHSTQVEEPQYTPTLTALVSSARTGKHANADVTPSEHSEYCANPPCWLQDSQRRPHHPRWTWQPHTP